MAVARRLTRRLRRTPLTTLTELAGSRELLSNLTLRELRGKYKRSALGWSWSLLNPLATMLIFTFVFRFVLRIQPAASDSGLQNYALFLLCGLLPWNFVAAGMTGSIAMLVGNANLIKKVYFPREILVVANVLSWDVSLLIELGVLAIALMFFGNMVLPWIPVVLALVALLTLFVIGLGLLLSVLNVYFRDVQHFVGIFLQIWFYATPVIYPLHLVEDQAGREFLGVSVLTLYKINPMVHFVEMFRDAFYDLGAPSLGSVLYAAAWSVGLLALGYAVFSKLEGRLAEEL